MGRHRIGGPTVLMGWTIARDSETKNGTPLRVTDGGWKVNRKLAFEQMFEGQIPANLSVRKASKQKPPFQFRSIENAV